MQVEWDPLAIPGLAAGFLSVVFGYLVYRARPERFQNRVMAVFVGLIGLGDAVRIGVRFLLPEKWAAYAAYQTGLVVFPTIAALLLVLASTLPTRLASPLRGPWARGTVLALGIGASLWFAAHPSLLAADMVLGQALGVWLGDKFGIWLLAVQVLAMAVGTYALLAVLSSLRAAQTALVRRRLRALGWALGAYIVLNMAYQAFAIWVITTSADFSDAPKEVINFFAPPLVDVVFVTVAAVGILRSQLFDIDVKLRWTLKRGTLAAIFLAVFFVAAQLAQNFLSSAYGWAFGGVAAGLTLFAINPLQRVAERVARTAVPASGPGEDPHVRKAEVYKAALEGALQDGTITERERHMLTRLQLELGISNAQARGLEDETAKLVAEG